MNFKFLCELFLIFLVNGASADRTGEGWGPDVVVYNQFVSLRFRHKFGHDCFGTIVSLKYVLTSSICLDTYAPAVIGSVKTMPCLYGRNHPLEKFGVRIVGKVFTAGSINSTDFEKGALQEMGVEFIIGDYIVNSWVGRPEVPSTAVYVMTDFEFRPQDVSLVTFQNASAQANWNNCFLYGRIQPTGVPENDTNLGNYSVKYISHDQCKQYFEKKEPLNHFCIDETGRSPRLVDFGRSVICSDVLIGVLARKTPLVKGKNIFVYAEVPPLPIPSSKPPLFKMFCIFLVMINRLVLRQNF